MNTHLDFALEVESLDNLLCDITYAHVVVLANGENDRLHPVILAQLPYKHLREVMREHKLAQRLARASNDKRRAIL